MMKNGNTRNLIFTALLVAVGVVFPRVVHLIPRGGNILLPMHYPVFIAGLLLGARSGITVGLICPLLSSVISGSPVLFPKGVAMMVELATYGAISGLLVKRVDLSAVAKRELRSVLTYVISLALAMLAGRLALGVTNFIIVQGYTLEAFLSSAFISALPGIAIQLAAIPLLSVPLQKLFSETFVRSEKVDD